MEPVVRGLRSAKIVTIPSAFLPSFGHIAGGTLMHSLL